MDENNQILDVTYGNFSCRLEGFDDSVETMKTVVAFFHDLAGHERFMDVPALAPDMDTLARLTEEQTGQPVEIEGEGHTVSLRAGQGTDDDDLMDDVAEDDDFDIDASVADKLQRIRAVVDGGKDIDDDDFTEDLGDEASDDAPVETLRDVFEDTAEEFEDESVNGLEQEAEADVEMDDNLVADYAADDLEEQVEDILATDALADDDNADATKLDEDETAASADDAVADDVSEVADQSPLVLTPDDAATETAVDDEADAYSNNDDAEFNLQDDIAKVEAEIAARENNGVARHGLPRSVEDAMSRIMSQTDQHLNQPESRRHRDAFAQLKAAVAATEAARQLGDQGAESVDPDEVFKDDLGAHDAEKRAQGQANAPAPLKLVPSQKVDPEPVVEEAEAQEETRQKPELVKTRIIESAFEESVPTDGRPLDAASERLRQIAALKETNGQSQDAGFAEFAAAQGAVDLVDRMEAAGAFICFVEGAADFSRPQVMKVVQSASDQEITREDGLRCFGRLLRQSRLIKLPNGRFQVAENTQYRPDGDKAAQG